MRLYTLLISFAVAEAATNSRSFRPASTSAFNGSPHRPLRENFFAGDSTLSPVVSLRGGASPEDCIAGAYDWCVNLGAPAALVAGAVVATLYENVRGGALEVQKNDSIYTRSAKKCTNMLLLSSFALQIVSIFVTTVTGTMLLSKDPGSFSTKATTPLAFLREHFEFEYLTSRISFLQGLMNWLAGVALEHTIPRKGEGKAARQMDNFVAGSLATLVILLLSFYNAHMTFYSNYFEMVSRWGHVAFSRFFTHYRPLMLLYIPVLAYSAHACVIALIPDPEEESDEERSC